MFRLLYRKFINNVSHKTWICAGDWWGTKPGGAASRPCCGVQFWMGLWGAGPQSGRQCFPPAWNTESVAREGLRLTPWNHIPFCDSYTNIAFLYHFYSKSWHWKVTKSNNRFGMFLEGWSLYSYFPMALRNASSFFPIQDTVFTGLFKLPNNALCYVQSKIC